MKTIRDYRNDSNMTYAEIAEKAGIGTDAAFRAINSPWRTRLETVLLVAKALEIPADIAENIWRKEKREYMMRKY